MVKGFVVCTVILIHACHRAAILVSWPQEGAPPIPRALREAAKAKQTTSLCELQVREVLITATASP